MHGYYLLVLECRDCGKAQIYFSLMIQFYFFPVVSRVRARWLTDAADSNCAFSLPNSTSYASSSTSSLFTGTGGGAAAKQTRVEKCNKQLWQHFHHARQQIKNNCHGHLKIFKKQHCVRITNNNDMHLTARWSSASWQGFSHLHPKASARGRRSHVTRTEIS